MNVNLVNYNESTTISTPIEVIRPICEIVDNEHGVDCHCSICNKDIDNTYAYYIRSHGYSRCPHCGALIEKVYGEDIETFKNDTWI